MTGLELARLALAAALSRSAPQLGTSGALSRRGASSTLPTAAQLRAGSRPGARSAGRGARGGDYYWVNERASGARGAATSACWRFLSLVALSSDVRLPFVAFRLAAAGFEPLYSGSQDPLRPRLGATANSPPD